MESVFTRSLMGGGDEIFKKMGLSASTPDTPKADVPSPVFQSPSPQGEAVAPNTPVGIPSLGRNMPMSSAEYDNEYGDEEMSVVDKVFSGYTLKEGSGDNVTNIRTGNLGVTDSARKAMNMTDMDEYSDEEVSHAYTTKLYKDWQKKAGFNDAPANVQEALLDTAYNVGPRVMRYKGLNKALAAGDYEGVGRNLLDTASVEGKASRGLARRRAESYNAIVPDKQITHIDQKEDGTLRYLDSEGNEVFSYRPKGGRHKTSAVGILEV